MISLNKNVTNSEIKKLDEIVRSASDLFTITKTDKQVQGSSNIQKLELYELSLFDYLVDTTNMSEEEKNLKYKFYDYQNNHFGLFFGILAEIKGLGTRKRTIKTFLMKLNEKLEDIRKKKQNKYKIAILLNIAPETNSQEQMKAISRACSSFGLNIMDRDDFGRHLDNLTKEFADKMRYYFHDHLIIYKEENARNDLFAISHANRSFESFVGFLMLNVHLFQDSKKWAQTKPDFSLTKFRYADVFLLIENGQLQYPKNQNMHDFEFDQYKISRQRIKLESSGIKRFDTLSKLLSKIKDKKIRSQMDAALSVYSKACINENLYVSFLQFWIINELLFRKTKKMDEVFVNTLMKLTRSELIRKRLWFVYKKRNEIAHQFKVDFISQGDRNLVKAIADAGILFCLSNYGVYHNFAELDFLMDNLENNIDDLGKRRKIIQNLIKLKRKEKQ